MRPNEDALDKKQIIATLAKSPHGDLREYLDVGLRAAAEDPDFFAHLVAWNHLHGQVRDAKVALPVIALRRYESNLYDENALAHLADLNPRLLAKALLPMTKVVKAENEKKATTVNVPAFAQVAKAPQRTLRRLVTRYLRDLEADRRDFERTAVLHRHVLRDLYAHYHVDRPQWVGEVLFQGEKGRSKVKPERGVFAVIRRLKDMGPEEAAGAIVQYKIPFLIARGALGAKAKQPDQVLALIKAMSPTELVSNMKWLESAGVKTVPALRGALEEALGRAATSKRAAATLKTTRAAEALEGDEKLSGKLRALQEKQLDQLGGIDGNWLVLADKSGSMGATMEIARQIAATLTRMVKGSVHLVFFDTMPYYVDATRGTLEELQKLTRHMQAVGGTSIGCGLQYALDKKLAVDGIVIVSDGGENTPPYFGTVYPKYCVAMGNEPTVYLYQTMGDSDSAFRRFCEQAHIDVQRFDLRQERVDYYSLPNVVKTMRVGRYQLLDDVMSTPLRTLDEVLERTKGMPVLPHAPTVTA